jgi:antitoxin CptB
MAHAETRDTRLRRLKMRSMRRGTKEMDILLIRYSGARLDGLSDAELDAYEALLDENDQDLYQWLSGQKPAPEAHQPMIDDIARTAFGAG